MNTKLYDIRIIYTQPLSCQSNGHQYHLSLKNVTIDNSLYLDICHGRSYNVNVITENVESNQGHFDAVICTNSFYHINITNVSRRNMYNGLRVLYHFEKTDDYFSNHIQNSSKLIIEKSQFDDNMRGLSILKLPGYNGEYAKIHHSILVKSCRIRNNKRYGLFLENYSSAVMKHYTISINDTEIIGNKQNGLIYTDVVLNNVISNSTATGLSILGSTVKINGSAFITNNIGKDGGGMAIHDDSVIILFPNTSVNISNNHAMHKGGGVYFRNRITCLFKSDMSVHVHMLNNTAAVAGDDSYGNIVNAVDYCPPVFRPKVIKLSSDAIGFKFCDPENTTIEQYNESIPKKEIFPGEKLKFYIAMQGVGYNNEDSITDGVIDINIDNEQKLKEVPVNANCSLVEFTPNQTEYTLHNVTLTIHQYFDQFPLSHGGISQLFDDSRTQKFLEFNYSVNHCPIGFINNSGKCICRENISRKGARCNINTQTIEHDGKKWIGEYNDTCFISEACLLHCASTGPVSFTMDRPDAQCEDNRGELMCGACKKSLLLGSNRCDECKNPHLTALYILIFALMGILLVVLLIALNLTVSNGMLNGLLFYANVIKLYKPIFSSKEYFKNSEYVSLVIASWSNLDFGFEVCFYEGMDRYFNEWLQFVFPFYVWIIIIVIIALSWKFGKISRLVGSHAIPVLSTLLLLSYTKLTHTIVIVLHKREVTLYCPDSKETLSLWYEDPTVEYGKGKHAGLLAFAILVLITFVIPYTLFLLLGQLYEKYLSNFKIFKKFWCHFKYLCFKPIIDAYSGPMKDKYRFWPGLLLVARIPLLLSVTLVDSYIESESLLLCILLVVVASLLSLHVCFGGFYRRRVHNIVEIWFLFNLCIVVGLEIVSEDDEKGIWFIICISIFNLSLIMMVFYHAHLQLSTKKWYRKLWSKKRNDEVIAESETDEHKTVFIQMSEIIPTSTDLDVACRESVVELY
uniref:Right handed beta helix domain-containing protein n=1 Tax=Amphimedon queenslandica TaxID=400682 RepID=A0A1X7UEH3_AMPQE